MKSKFYNLQSSLTIVGKERPVKKAFNLITNSINPLAMAFAARIISNGGNTLTNTELTAISNLITDLQVAGLYTKFDAIYPFIGGNGGANSINSYEVNLISTSFYLNPINVTNANCNNGWTANGTTSYFDTGYNVLNVANELNCGLCFYSMTNNPGVTFDDMGATTVPNSYKLSVYGGNIEGDIMNLSLFVGRNSTPVADSLGLISMSRIAANSFSVYKRGVNLNTNTLNGGSTFNATIYLGSCNQGGPIDFSNRTYGFFGIKNTGFTDSQEATLYSLIQTFQTALGRQV